MMDFFARLFYSGKLKDLPNPKPRIKKGDVSLENGTLTVKNLPEGTILTGVAHTLSMDPWMDIDGVQVLQPFTDSADLQVGDVITYDPQDRSGKWRMHPIIEITSDSLGWYCRTKGINVPIADRERIRADWIKYVYIGQLIAK